MMILVLKLKVHRSTTKKKRHCLKNHKNKGCDIIFDLFVMVMKVNANIAENQGMIDKFQEHIC